MSKWHVPKWQIKEYILKEQFTILYKKYEDVILYLFWGVMATLLNILLYEVFTEWFHMNYVIANGIDWFLCVMFAYVTNRIYVFRSTVTGIKGILGEFGKFFSCRVISGIMDMAIMIVMVEYMLIDDSIAKIVTQFVVVVSNYVFSKVFIFRK